jgi:hypothetical protein
MPGASLGMRRRVQVGLLVAPLLVVSCKKPAPLGPAPAASHAESAGAPASAASSVVASAGATATPPGSNARDDATEGGRPLTYDRAVTDADLAGRTLRQLGIMRNFAFARAGQEFRKDWLKEYFGQYSWYRPRAPEVEVSELARDNAAKIANFEAAIPRPELQKRADEVLARTRANQAEKTDALELRLLSERLGTWLVSGDSNVRPSPLEKPELLEQVLPLDDLGNLSRRDLRILRNTVYARKGRDFVSEGLREYFATKAWYQKDEGYSDKKLSAVDWKNIKLISSVEDTLGGPLSDGEHFGRTYGWFGGA